MVAAPQVAVVLLRRESLPATHTILARAQSRTSSLTWRISAASAVSPGQHHTRRPGAVHFSRAQ
jgi:hypothetical protein